MRRLRVPAQGRLVMDWLTDPDRREREWRQRAGAEEDVQQRSVSRLPGGGLRFDLVLRRGNRLFRLVTEDVAIQGHRIDRAHHAELSRPYAMPARWVMNERITVESLGDQADVTVRVWGQMKGMGRALYLFGYHDTTTARTLTEEASRRADFRISGIAARFAGPDHTDVNTKDTG